MRIDLLDVDRSRNSHFQGRMKSYPNLALMKLSAFHKARGDLVEIL